MSMLVDAIAIAIQSNTPVILWGGPGNGKTSTIMSIGRTLGLHTEVVLGSLSEPSDFAGLPIVGDDGFVSMSPKSWAVRLSKMERGLLFFDEITCVPPVTQSALLKVILEGVVGELKLPSGIFRCAAANPPEQAAGGFDLSAPLANRFTHIDWDLPFQDWSIGMISGFIDAPVPILPKNWRSQIPLHRVAIVSFLRTNPLLMYQLPKLDTEVSKGWPSHRSWDAAAVLLTACNSVNASPDIINCLLSGTVGKGAALEFTTYISRMDLPDPEELLAYPDKFKLPNSMDKQYVVLNALTSAVINNYTHERWDAIWKIIAKALDGTAEDVSIPAARTLLEVISQKIRDGQIQGEVMNPTSINVMRKFLPLMKKTGLLIKPE